MREGSGGVTASEVQAGSPCFGAVLDIDSYVSFDSEGVSEESTGFGEHPRPLPVGHQDDPTEGTQEANQLVGVKRDVPGTDFVLRLSER